MASHKKTDVLIVDDREANLTAMEAVLDEPDWNVVKARSGKEALLRFQERDFAVILLDVQMPGMDGFALAEMIRKNRRYEQVPILFVSAVAQTCLRLFREKGYRLPE